MRALSFCGKLRVMIAILPWVDRVIWSSRLDILSFPSAVGASLEAKNIVICKRYRYWLKN